MKKKKQNRSNKKKSRREEGGLGPLTGGGGGCQGGYEPRIVEVNVIMQKSRGLGLVRGSGWGEEGWLVVGLG